jgi:hypothetical protein
MNRLTKFTFGTALNAICATVGLGLAAVAISQQVPCGTPVNGNCNIYCDGYISGPSFSCCNTYGTSCCRRSCNTITCTGDIGSGCNFTPQVASTAGVTLIDASCSVKGTCLQ